MQYHFLQGNGNGLQDQQNFFECPIYFYNYTTSYALSYGVAFVAKPMVIKKNLYQECGKFDWQILLSLHHLKMQFYRLLKNGRTLHPQMRQHINDTGA